MVFDTPVEAQTDWYEQNREWYDREPADGRASIDPDRARANHAARWRVTYTVGATPLESGAVICLEVPILWDIDMGRCFAHSGLQPAGSVGSGMGVAVQAQAIPDTASLALEVHNTGRFYLCYAEVTEGELTQSDEIVFTLGAAPGSLLRCQRHAQDCVLAMAVDFDGSGTFYRTEPQPTVKLFGSHPRTLKVFVPATVTGEEQFAARVYAADGVAHNPSAGFRGTVSFRGRDVSGPANVLLDEITDVDGFRCDGPFGSISVCDHERGLAGKSSPVARDFVAGRNIYFGDLHGQVYASIGTGTLEEYFSWGRDVERLDFCASANHYGGRRHVTREEWQKVVDTSNAFYAPGSYVTFVSYEWAAKGGHKNVYYRGDTGDIFVREGLTAYAPHASDPDELWERLAGTQTLTIPHHPNYIGGVDWAYRNPQMQRVVEIASKWGMSETDGPNCVQSALLMGHRVGFIGGTDTHSGQPGHGPHHCNEGIALGAVFAPELTREAIWDALHERRCYAVYGDDRIILDFTLNGEPMGRELHRDEAGSPARSLRARVAARDDIDRIDIIRNCEVIHSCAPGDWQAELQFEDSDALDSLFIEPTFQGDVPFAFYYVRVLTGAGNYAWSSPIWINAR